MHIIDAEMQNVVNDEEFTGDDREQAKEDTEQAAEYHNAPSEGLPY